jgi:cytidine deaminase
MKSLKLNIEFSEFDSDTELNEDDRALLKEAREAVKNAYAPYSRFYVGAAVRLANGKIVTGSNQENAAYPSGLCAERVAVFSASSQYPGTAIATLALMAQTEMIDLNSPVTPCGSCRQVLAEYQQLYNTPIRIFMQAGRTIYFTEGIENLLPLMFDAPGLKK